MENSQTISKYIHTKTHTGEGRLTPASFLLPVKTDMDIFPYNRYFRGMVDCPNPRIFDREAGHRRWDMQNYAYQFHPEIITPRRFEGCFQIPCSTILPCVNVDGAFKRPIDYCVNISP